MAKKNIETQTPGVEPETPISPNRDTYAQMWGEDNGDIDFEDKEARYGRAIDDRNELRERRKADSALGGLFENHNWLASMFMELKDNPDIDPFEWLEGFCNKNDITLQEVIENPDARKRLTERMNEHQKKEAEKKASAEEKDKNLQKSLDELESLQQETGMSDEDALKIWGDFWEMYDSASKGLVNKNTWKLYTNGRSYDSDIESARNEGGMMARNEKIQNKLRRPSEEVAGLPPTLDQGSGSTPKRQPKGDDSFISGLNDM